MFLDPTMLIISGMSVITGIILILYAFYTRRLIYQDYFRAFFGWLIVSAVFFTTGFLTNFFEIAGLNGIMEIIRHLLIMVAVFIITIAVINLSIEIKSQK
ncbi:MAG: hypothetical protein QMD50_02050 [Patescibacteria group bacterium]|nr:hypothetical protein [Patescibacteria group bacterium]